MAGRVWAQQWKGAKTDVMMTEPGLLLTLKILQEAWEVSLPYSKLRKKMGIFYHTTSTGIQDALTVGECICGLLSSSTPLKIFKFKRLKYCNTNLPFYMVSVCPVWLRIAGLPAITPRMSFSAIPTVTFHPCNDQRDNMSYKSFEQFNTFPIQFQLWNFAYRYTRKRDLALKNSPIPFA